MSFHHHPDYFDIEDLPRGYSIEELFRCVKIYERVQHELLDLEKAEFPDTPTVEVQVNLLQRILEA